MGVGCCCCQCSSDEQNAPLPDNASASWSQYAAMGTELDDRFGPPAPVKMPEEVIKLDYLERLGHLGHGLTSVVELHQNKRTTDVYALKIVSKGHVMRLKKQQHVVKEKQMLTMVDSPFIVKLLATLATAQRLYFVLEPALGGQLRHTYWEKKLYGSEVHCLFYTASVVLTLAYLHEKHIAYRDLKPENILLDSFGNVKFVDFGAAKVVLDKTFTREGTPDYMAPEVCKKEGHSQPVDWWALGILMHELMAKSTPFSADTPTAIYEKILKGVSHVVFPDVLKGAAKDIIVDLLQNDPAARLACRQPHGVSELQDHPWFIGFDWQGMNAQAIPAPYVPLVRSKTDLANYAGIDPPKTEKFVECKDDANVSWADNFASLSETKEDEWIIRPAA